MRCRLTSSTAFICLVKISCGNDDIYEKCINPLIVSMTFIQKASNDKLVQYIANHLIYHE